MSFMDLLKKGVETAAEYGKSKMAAELERRFPGFTTEALKQGWLPVPESVLEAGLQRLVADVDEVEAIRLSCKPGQFQVEVDTKAYWVMKNRLQVTIAVTEFTLNDARQHASLECDDDVRVEGRNLVGQIALGLVENILQNALRSADTSAKVESSSEGIVVMDWPKIELDLSSLAEVKRIKEATILGIGMFDLLELGPVTAEDKHARLKIGWRAGQGPEGSAKPEVDG